MLRPPQHLPMVLFGKVPRQLMNPAQMQLPPPAEPSPKCRGKHRPHANAGLPRLRRRLPANRLLCPYRVPRALRSDLANE